MKHASVPLIRGFHQPLHVLAEATDRTDYRVVRVGTEVNGQLLTLYSLIHNDCFMRVRFKALGSSTFIASVEYMCAYLEGRSINDLADFLSFSILEEQGLDSKHQHVAVLIDQAIRQSIKRYQDDTATKQ